MNVREAKALLYLSCFGVALSIFGTADSLRELFAVSRQEHALSSYVTEEAVAASAVMKLIKDESERRVVSAELTAKQRQFDAMQQIALKRLSETRLMILKYGALLAVTGLLLGVTAVHLGRIVRNEKAKGHS
jgi:hypothetical protein